jgi:hypothetical protein
MAHTAFVERLKKHKGKLPAAFQEEFLRPDNTLDTKYISKLLEGNITEARFRSIVNAELGTIHFNRDKNENEVNKEIFEEHYVFGTYPDTRGWIGHFSRVLDLVLTREKLYAYLSTNSQS